MSFSNKNETLLSHYETEVYVLSEQTRFSFRGY